MRFESYSDMTKRKVLLIGLAILLLGAVQTWHSYGSPSQGKPTAIAKASGVISLLSGAGIIAYGFSIRKHR